MSNKRDQTISNKYVKILTWAAVLAVVASGVGVQPAFASSTGSVANRETSTKIADVMSALHNIDDLAVADSESAVFADLHEGDASEVGITIPLSAAEPITLSREGATISVTTPATGTSDAAVQAANGVIVYPNAKGFSTVPLVKDESSVQFVTLIDGSHSPTTYSYDFSMQTLALQAGGMVTLTGEDGSLTGMILPAWAKDATGANIPTHYEVRGSSLTQVVEHRTHPQVTYPVVADPYLGKSQIASIKTVYRDSRGATTVVTPTSWGRLNGNNPIAVDGLYKEWLAKMPPAYRTKNMWWQMGCHAQFAPLKSTWNLDSYIRRLSYFDSVKHACN